MRLSAAQKKYLKPYQRLGVVIEHEIKLPCGLSLVPKASRYGSREGEWIASLFGGDGKAPKYWERQGNPQLGTIWATHASLVRQIVARRKHRKPANVSISQMTDSYLPVFGLRSPHEASMRSRSKTVEWINIHAKAIEKQAWQIVAARRMGMLLTDVKEQCAANWRSQDRLVNLRVADDFKILLGHWAHLPPTEAGRKSMGWYRKSTRVLMVGIDWIRDNCKAKETKNTEATPHSDAWQEALRRAREMGV